MQHFEAGTNTNLANNRFSQTQPIKVNMQSTNIPSQNQISTHNDSCKCEDDEWTTQEFNTDQTMQDNFNRVK